MFLSLVTCLADGLERFGVTCQPSRVCKWVDFFVACLGNSRAENAGVSGIFVDHQAKKCQNFKDFCDHQVEFLGYLRTTRVKMLEILGPGPTRKMRNRKHNRMGKTKTTNEKHRNTFAASRPKKTSEGVSKLSPTSSKRIQTRAGPRMAPREKHPEKGRTGKVGDKPTAAGQKKTDQKREVWEWPVTT